MFGVYTYTAAERCGYTQTVGRAVGQGDYKYVISRWHIKKGLNTRRHRFNGSGLEEKKQNGYGGDDNDGDNNIYYGRRVSVMCFSYFSFSL